MTAMWILEPDRGLVLRKAGLSDAETMQRLGAAAFGSESTGRSVRHCLEISLAYDVEHEAMVSATYYLLAERDRPVGFSGLYTRTWDDPEDGNYWLGWFGLDPSCRGRGLGELMLRATTGICAAKGGKRLCIETSNVLEAARRLYRRCGFHEVPAIPGYYGGDVDMVLCWRDVTDWAGPIPPEGANL